MKKLLIISTILAVASPAYADNFFTRFWNESRPYAEIDIVKVLSSGMINYIKEDDDLDWSASGYEAGLGIEYKEWLELGVHHTKIMSSSATYEQYLIKSKFKLANEYRLTPFVGIGAGLGQYLDNAFTYEISAGFDGEMTDKVNIRTQLYYSYQPIGEREDYDFDDIGVKVGIQFNF